MKQDPLPKVPVTGDISREHWKMPVPGLRPGTDDTIELITIDHEKMGGLPCIRHLRIPVGTILGQLVAGRAAREILEDFPDLEQADILAALEYAAAAVQGRELPLAAR